MRFEAMIKSILKRQITQEEVRVGASTDWARHVLKYSTEAFLKYVLLIPLSRHRRHASAEAISVAKLIAVEKEDCGSCVQIAINEAKEMGVSKEIIRDVIQHKFNQLPTELQITVNFAVAILERNSQENEAREKLILALGERAHVEISIAIATARFYPTVKRALGFSQACGLEAYKI
jgi:hypothetical protein